MMINFFKKIFKTEDYSEIPSIESVRARTDYYNFKQEKLWRDDLYYFVKNLVKKAANEGKERETFNITCVSSHDMPKPNIYMKIMEELITAYTKKGYDIHRLNIDPAGTSYVVSWKKDNK